VVADVLIAIAGVALIVAVCAGLVWRFGLWERTFGRKD
jgi:hypothetical protein